MKCPNNNDVCNEILKAASMNKERNANLDFIELPPSLDVESAIHEWLKENPRESNAKMCHCEKPKMIEDVKREP